MQIRQFLLVFSIFLCSFFYTGLACAQNAPENVPTLLQNAIDSMQGEEAVKYFDMEQVINDIINTQLPVINQKAVNGEIKLNQQLFVALASLNSGNAATRRTTVLFLSSELNKFILYGVNSGNFAGKPLSENVQMTMDKGIFGQLGTISLERKEFTGTKLVAASNNKATVATSLYDHGAKRAYPLVLKMQKYDTMWKITAIENISELVAGM
ncbi:hypothetical protein LJB93_03110 [Desulfovibrio sp. OttesenSCG-928-F07]|nr:hypothetical protein [Desulfovibrio sp. OttesenSCG-928-F07]